MVIYCIQQINLIDKLPIRLITINCIQLFIIDDYLLCNVIYRTQKIGEFIIRTVGMTSAAS